tara:strand:- start:1013 stop:1396 length:384 start_codon:yes stop_codon:yes gene_type:complete
MKYLSDYMEQPQTDLFNKTGTFFAFSNKQYEEQAKTGKKYVDMGGGMVTPTEYVKEVIETLHTIYQKSMDQDIKENGIEAIIKRELENYEAYYTNDLEPVTEALEDYPNITQKDIIKVYQRKWNEIQ